ncbi:hypothetical protein HG531_010268 [Fusarium graminearum]|nr:hypothetical protein HG531_010268 [Fusarium graminearum]
MEEPAGTREFQRGVKIDDLVAHDNFKHKALHGWAFWFALIVVSPPARLLLSCLVLECSNPRMNCTLKACEKYRLNLSIQLTHPEVQVYVLFKVQLINSRLNRIQSAMECRFLYGNSRCETADKHAMLALSIFGQAELMAFGMQSPVRAENSLYLAHVPIQLELDLARPDDGTRYRGKITKLGHGTIDSLLDVVHQLVLILLDSATNLGAHEKCVELGENSKHFVCSLGSSESIAKSGNDGVLYSSCTFVVKILGSYPSLFTLVCDIQHVDILKSLPSLLDFLDSVNIAHLLDDDTIRSSGLGHTWDGGLRAKNGDNSALELLMVVTESADILDSCLKFRVLLDDLDGDEFLVSAAGHFTSYVGKFLDMLLPGLENMVAGLHDVLELLVIKVNQFGTRQQPVKHIVKIGGDGFNKGKSPSNRPKIDFLACSTKLLVRIRGRVLGQLGDSLNRLDPSVDIGLQSVEESTVLKKILRDPINVGSVVVGFGVIEDGLDNRMERKGDLGNIDILLEMQQA